MKIAAIPYLLLACAVAHADVLNTSGGTASSVPVYTDSVTVTKSQIYADSSQSVTVANSSLTITGAGLAVSGGSVLVNGTNGSTPVSGAGTRLMWIPAKAAFRAGTVYDSAWNDAQIQNYSFVFGYVNANSGAYSTISGGNNNSVSGTKSVISGGEYNTVSTGDSVIAGGSNNIATGSDYEVLVGGYHNSVSGNSSVLSGGYYNSVSGADSVVSGGNGNSVTATESVVSGGAYNQANANDAVISGGSNNTVSQIRTVVAGGYHNTASNYDAVVSGGYYNLASGIDVSVGGGNLNTASAENAAVGGGYSNTASGTSATVPGGENNTAYGSYSFAAGRRAKATANGAFAVSDSQDADFVLTSTDTFGARFAGGYQLNGGSIGIGTANPVEKLEVNGSIKADYGIAAATATVSGTLTLNNVPYTMPSTQGSNGQYLGESLTPGVLQWASPAASTETVSGTKTFVSTAAFSQGNVFVDGYPAFLPQVLISNNWVGQSTGTYAVNFTTGTYEMTIIGVTSGGDLRYRFNSDSSAKYNGAGFTESDTNNNAGNGYTSNSDGKLCSGDTNAMSCTIRFYIGPNKYILHTGQQQTYVNTNTTFFGGRWTGGAYAFSMSIFTTTGTANVRIVMRKID
ncbi:MAG: hypothetical protein WC421_10760 [Elusimicrobiales bacterium]